VAIVTDTDGNQILEFIVSKSPVIPPNDKDIPLTFCLIVVVYQDNILLIFNPTRKTWEIPGGGIINGETPESAVLRELKEESGQILKAASYKGMLKWKFHDSGKVEFAALYYGELTQLAPFEFNEESGGILLWDGTTPVIPISPINHKLIELGRML